MTRFPSTRNATTAAPESSFMRANRLIGDLFSEARRPPSYVVCDQCWRGPHFTDIAHSTGEDGICLWPCNHMVTYGETRCYLCQPLTEQEASGDVF